MHRINRRLAAYNIEMVERLCEVLTPDMIGFAEDMSYNHGPIDRASGRGRHARGV